MTPFQKSSPSRSRVRKRRREARTAQQVSEEFVTTAEVLRNDIDDNDESNQEELQLDL